VVVPADELRVEFSRAGGPGGQNVNKVETRAVLRFDVRRSTAFDPEQRDHVLRRLAGRLTARGELLVACSEHRTQSRNLDAARERLAALLRAALAVPKVRRPTRPTRSATRRRLETKRRRSGVKRARGRAEEE
jgi:ribosome-associated protein